MLNLKLLWYTIENVHKEQGTFVLELYYNHAPKTCENFVGLIKQGFYDGICFHRIIAVCFCLWLSIIQNFMIQGGDPTGTGRFSKSIWGYSIVILF